MIAPVTFYVPGNISGPSGGNTYNDAVIGQLRARGIAVQVRPVPGHWPRPSPWRGPDQGQIAVVDGLLASPSPGAIRRAVTAGGRVWVLVHMATPADPALTPADRIRARNLERAALHAATGVVATSHWSKADLRARYDLTRVQVASPGVDPAPLAAGSDPPQFLVLGAMTPVKNQAMILRALLLLQDLPWSAHLVGSMEADPGYAAHLRDVARDFEPGRLTLHEAQQGATLAQRWNRTDLCLLCSRTETFGLVVTEALARGIPAIVSRGTGAEEALRGGPVVSAGGPCAAAIPGAAVSAGDPPALAALLRRWLTDPELRAGWQRAARARRAVLPTWQDTAATWARILARGR